MVKPVAFFFFLSCGMFCLLPFSFSSNHSFFFFFQATQMTLSEVWWLTVGVTFFIHPSTTSTAYPPLGKIWGKPQFLPKQDFVRSPHSHIVSPDCIVSHKTSIIPHAYEYQNVLPAKMILTLLSTLSWAGERREEPALDTHAEKGTAAWSRLTFYSGRGHCVRQGGRVWVGGGGGGGGSSTPTPPHRPITTPIYYDHNEASSSSSSLSAVWTLASGHSHSAPLLPR